MLKYPGSSFGQITSEVVILISRYQEVNMFTLFIISSIPVAINSSIKKDIIYFIAHDAFMEKLHQVRSKKESQISTYKCHFYVNMLMFIKCDLFVNITEILLKQT